jgi:hypothetical protein
MSPAMIAASFLSTVTPRYSGSRLQHGRDFSHSQLSAQKVSAVDAICMPF